VTFRSLDLTAPHAESELAGLMEGVAHVVNLSGALLRPRLPDDSYRRLHVDGAASVLAVARAAVSDGCQFRLVHVSTTGVLGPTGREPRDEETPPRPTTIYEATKLEGERATLNGRGGGLEVVVIRPGLVYGPRDRHLLGLYRSIAGGSFRLVAGGKALWQPIHVDDVARGLESAILAADCDGLCFHLAGAEVVSVAELAARIARVLGTRIRRPALPYPVAWLAGALLEILCLPLGGEPPLTRSRVRTLTADRVYAIERSGRLLGGPPRVSLDEGLRRTVAWYVEHGDLRGRA
jgi:nucleoside-diphosphate-sugar epimerase